MIGTSSGSSDIVLLLMQQNNELHSQNNELHSEVKAIMREKEVVVVKEIKEKHALELEVLQLQQQLKTDADIYLELKNARNIRGALEYAATRLSSGGTDRALKDLRHLPQYADTFRHKLKFILQQHKLREKDVLQCVDNLYHSFSKAMHGSETHVYLRQKDLVPTECAALALVFEVTCIPYRVIDQQGIELLESPYHCRCLPSTRCQEESTDSSVLSSSTAGDSTAGSTAGGRARGNSKAGRQVTSQHTQGRGKAKGPRS
jgi:hypothetical protein